MEIIEKEFMITNIDYENKEKDISPNESEFFRLCDCIRNKENIYVKKNNK